MSRPKKQENQGEGEKGVLLLEEAQDL